MRKVTCARILAIVGVTYMLLGSSTGATAKPLDFCFQEQDMRVTAGDDVIWNKRVQEHRCFRMEVTYTVTHTAAFIVGEKVRYLAEVIVNLSDQVAYPAYSVFADDPLKNTGLSA